MIRKIPIAIVLFFVMAMVFAQGIAPPAEANPPPMMQVTLITVPIGQRSAVAQAVLSSIQNPFTANPSSQVTRAHRTPVAKGDVVIWEMFEAQLARSSARQVSEGLPRFFHYPVTRNAGPLFLRC